MVCPQCGKENVNIKREKVGEIRDKGGVIKQPRPASWWIYGWFLVLCDICTLGISHLFIKWSWFHKKPVKVASKGMVSINHTIAYCKDCGYTWETSAN